MNDDALSATQIVLPLPEPTSEERLRMEAAMWKRRYEAACDRLTAVTAALAVWALRVGGEAWELKETPQTTAARLVRIAMKADNVITQTMLEGGLNNSTAEVLGLHELLEALEGREYA